MVKVLITNMLIKSNTHNTSFHQFYSRLHVSTRNCEP